MVKRIRDQSHAKETEVDHPPKRSTGRRGRPKSATGGSRAKRSSEDVAEPTSHRRGRRRKSELEKLQDSLTPHFAVPDEEKEEDLEDERHFEKAVVSSTVRRTFGYSPEQRVHEERREYVTGRESPDELPLRSRSSAVRARNAARTTTREAPLRQPLPRPNFRAAMMEESAPAAQQQRRSSRRESTESLSRDQRLQQEWTREAFHRRGGPLSEAPITPARGRTRAQDEDQEEATAASPMHGMRHGPPQRTLFSVLWGLVRFFFYPIIALTRWVAGWRLWSWALIKFDNIIGLGEYTLRPASLRERIPFILATIMHPMTVAGRLWRSVGARTGPESETETEPAAATEVSEQLSMWQRFTRGIMFVARLPMLLARYVAYSIGFVIGLLSDVPRWTFGKLRSGVSAIWRLAYKYRYHLFVLGLAVAAAWVLPMLLSSAYTAVKPSTGWTGWRLWQHVKHFVPGWLDPTGLVRRLWSGVTWFNPWRFIRGFFPSISLPSLGWFSGKQGWGSFYRPGGPTMPNYFDSWTPERSFYTNKQYVNELIRDIDHAQQTIAQTQRYTDGALKAVTDKLQKLLEYQQLLSQQLDGLEAKSNQASLPELQVLVDEVTSMYTEAQQAHQLLLASTTELQDRYRHIAKGDVSADIKNADQLFATTANTIYQLEVESASLVNQLNMAANRIEVGLSQAQASEIVDTLYAQASENLRKQLQGTNAEKLISRLVVEIAADLKASGRIVTVERIKERIEQILQEQVADIPLIDYAAAAMGATVVKGEPYTSAPYVSFLDFRTNIRYLLGLERAGAVPEVVLSHGKHTWRNCYAFQGNQGTITVKLSQPIFPTQIGIYHLLKNVAVTPESAPSRFRVWGWKRSPEPAKTISELIWPLNKASHPPQERPSSFDAPFYDGWNKGGAITEDDRVDLGEYSYDMSKNEALQVSLLDKSYLDRLFEPIEAITLQVLDNHGHLEYTCLYGLRVYGGEPPSQTHIH